MIHFIYAPVPALSRKEAGSVGLYVIDGFQVFVNVNVYLDQIDAN